MVSHSGGAAGYSTWLGRFTDYGLSVAVTCNFDPVSATNLAGRVADLFLPPVDPKAPRPGPVAAPGVDVSGRVGLYLEERTGDPMRLVVIGGRLGIASAIPLVPVSADRFRPQRATLFYRSEDDFELTFRSNDEFEIKSMEGRVSVYRRAPSMTFNAADAKELDGRYRSDDVTQVFEVLPGTKGVLVRMERSPEKVIEAEPVARDTYMQSMLVVHFVRDASGKVTGFDYSSPVVKNMRFARIGDRVATSPALPEAKAAAPTTTVTTALRLENLVGEYELAPGRNLAITLENGKLNGQPSGGGAKLPLSFVSGTTFSAEGRPITLTFTIGADGKATALVMSQNGNERTLKKVQ
jgi:hypothetical protein